MVRLKPMLDPLVEGSVGVIPYPVAVMDRSRIPEPVREVAVVMAHPVARPHLVPNPVMAWNC